MSLSMEKCAAVLDRNRTDSLRLVNEGRSLLKEAALNGMDTRLLDSMNDYVERCHSARVEMHERRRPFTTFLTALQKKFVAEENAISPLQSDSPAAEIKTGICAWHQAEMDEAEEAGQRLLKNREAYERRLSKRADMDDGQRHAALQRADVRLVTGQKLLKEKAVKTELSLTVRSTDGYLEVFKCWWEEIGRGLPAADLERHLHPMLSFARKQAKKGILIAGNGIGYKAVPAL